VSLSFAARAAASVAAAWLAAGCGPPTLRVTPPPLGAEAVSLLGDTLWSVRLPAEEGQARVSQLADAKRRAGVRRDDLNVQLLLGRRTANMGRLREAIDLYTVAIEAVPSDPRPYRRRGELLLLVREPDRAARDLQDAVNRARRNPAAKEFTEGPDGQLVGTTLLYGSLLQLGMTHYVRGDYRRAHAALLGAAQSSEDGDGLAAATLWLLFTLRRAGRAEESGQVARLIPADLPVVTRRAEHRLLQAFAGSIPLDSLQRELAGADPETAGLYLYGVGVSLLAGGRLADAAGTMDEVRHAAGWATMVHVAAEADLARLRHPCSAARPASPAETRWNPCLVTAIK